MQLTHAPELLLILNLFEADREQHEAIDLGSDTGSVRNPEPGCMVPCVHSGCGPLFFQIPIRTHVVM